MAGWHHMNGHELGQTSGDGERQGGLVCCGPWDLEESDTNSQLNRRGWCAASCGLSLAGGALQELSWLMAPPGRSVFGAGRWASWSAFDEAAV